MLSTVLWVGSYITNHNFHLLFTPLRACVTFNTPYHQLHFITCLSSAAPHSFRKVFPHYAPSLLLPFIPPYRTGAPLLLILWMNDHSLALLRGQGYAHGDLRPTPPTISPPHSSSMPPVSARLWRSALHSGMGTSSEWRLVLCASCAEN